MKVVACILAGAALVRPAVAPAQTRDSRATVQGAVTSGTIPRSHVPNEFLDIVATGASIRISPATDDSVLWSLIQPPSRPGEPDRVDYVGVLAMNDRTTLRVVDPIPDAKPRDGLILDVRVPRTLKLVHVTLHGAGQVNVAYLKGEVNVVVDTGSISGEHLQGPVIFEARHGSIGLILPDSVARSGGVNLLSHYGSIEITFGAHPSAALDLVSNCGNIHWDAGLVAQLRPGNPTQSAGRYPDADCTERPVALPPLPGVLHLQNNQALKIGSGTPSITAMSIQGDIDIRQRGESAVHFRLGAFN